MAKIVFTVDDINYRGGGHFATFRIAGHLFRRGHRVILYSPVKAEAAIRAQIADGVEITQSPSFSDADYIVVPFENSVFFEKVAKRKSGHARKIQWIHIDYDVWKDVVRDDTERRRQLLAAYDRIVFVSESNRKSFLKYFPECAEKSAVVYNFVDSEGIRAMAAEPVDAEIFSRKSAGQLTVVLPGRLEEQKAFHRMLDAAKILKERGTDIEWLILGRGHEYGSLMQKKERYGLENVHFLGFRQNPYPYMKAADLVAILSEYEGLALTVTESLTVGTPVLSTCTGGVAEMLSDEYGWILDNDLLSIVDGMTAVYNDRKSLEEKRAALRCYAYDNERIKESLEALFPTSEERGHPVMNTQTVFPAPAPETKTPDISIIIPVYNTAGYLAECLDSAAEQSFGNYEIILVNDGSTDGSQRIIDDYVYRYPDRIRAFTIPNGGLGNARNYGIGKARGKYLAFVDSDDYIRRDMLQKMYEAARRHNADCVMTDYIAFWDDGRQEYVRSVDLPDAGRPDIMKYSAKYGTVNICTKLVARELFDVIRFPAGFYEDLATTPILLSWAKNICYVREGLYFYRQRPGSITSIKSGDKRLLDCYAAWDRIREHANPLFEKELQFAVYWSLNFFCTNFLDDFTKHSVEYYNRNREYFRGNACIADAVRKGELLDFEHMDVIPKIIHYCWFGGGKKSELIQKCMDSWKKYAPDFAIIEWNESNCDIHANRYVEEAYEKKKYAFVSDYFRLKALYDFGGVYMDTDTELHRMLEDYLYEKAFFAFETPVFIHAGILGAVKNFELIGELRQSYENDSLLGTEADGEPVTIPYRLTQLLKDRTNLQPNGKSQLLEGNIRIFSANRMTVNVHDGKCICCHHYEGSWLKRNDGPAADYTYEVLRHYFTWDLLHEGGVPLTGAQAQLLAYYKSECDRYENSTCWKITKPLRILGDFLKKIFRRNEGS